MAENHGVILLDSEMDEICRIVDAMRNESKVPQYDVELRLASEAVREWREMADALYAVRDCSKREHRRRAAENRYLRLKAANDTHGQ